MKKKPKPLPPEIQRELSKPRYIVCEIEREENGKPITRDGGEGEPTLYRLSMSSETPIQKPWGREILSHKSSAIDTTYLKRGMAVLIRHGIEESYPVGVIREFEINEERGKLYGWAQFSRNTRGQEVQRDVDDGVLHFTSIGADPLKVKVTENPDPMKREILFTRWLPKEVSLAAIPDDPTVGIGREHEGTTAPVEIEGAETGVEESSMKCQTCGNVHEGACPTPNPGANVTAEQLTRERDEATKIARENTAAIFALVAANGLPPATAEKYVKDGLTRDQAAWEILQSKTTSGPVGGDSAEALGFKARDLRRYSIARAIHGAVLMREGKANKIAGLEGEVHAELLKIMPANGELHGGVLIPHRLREAVPELQRTLAANAATAGAETVFDQPGEMIELLRNAAAAASLGARILTGLSAPVPFAKQTGAAIARWRGENTGAVAASQLATGIVSLSPHELAASTSYSRQLLATSSEDTDAMVRDDLALVHGLAIDLAAFHGAGAAGEPTGIYMAPDVQVASSFATPTWTKLVVQIMAKIAKKNAARGKLGWVTTPEYAALMATTPKISGAAAGFLWDGDPTDRGTIAGRPAIASNQISSTMSGSAPTGGSEHGLIFGNWNDMLIGLWGGMEIIPDPYTLADQGLVKISTFQLADVLIRHGESFCKATGATLT